LGLQEKGTSIRTCRGLRGSYDLGGKTYRTLGVLLEDNGKEKPWKGAEKTNRAVPFDATQEKGGWWESGQVNRRAVEGKNIPSSLLRGTVRKGYSNEPAPPLCKRHLRHLAPRVTVSSCLLVIPGKTFWEQLDKKRRHQSTKKTIAAIYKCCPLRAVKERRADSEQKVE